MRTFDAPGLDDFTTPLQVTSDPRKAFPFRQDLTAILYMEDYVQRADFFEPLALDTQHPDILDAYLVDETNPTVRNDGLFRWTRTYATVPADRTEYERGSFNFPAYKVASATILNTRDNFTQSVVSKVTYSYLLTTDPGTDLTVTDRFQPLDDSSNVCNFVASDTTPTLVTYQGYVSGGTYVQSRETEVSRWKGNIWQMKNISVKAL